MNTEELQIVQNLYNAISAFDQTLVNYEQDSSNENREIFAKAHADAKALVDSAPIDIKGEISDLWGQIDLTMQGLKVGTNKFTKFTSFGMSAGTSGAQLNMIRGSIGKILKILKDMMSGKSGASATQGASVELSAEDKVIVQNIYDAVSVFDQTLINYEQDSSSENREAFAKAHADAKALIDSAPIDIKGEISDAWGQIDLSMQGLKFGTNKFAKISSFGMSAGTSGAQLNMIRGSIGKILKTLKDMLSGKSSASAVQGATVELSAEDKATVQNIYDAVSVFDQTLANYEKDSSNENREIFAKAHADAKALVDSAPIDIKGEISDLWGQIDLSMQGLKVGTNKFTKITSFGMSAGTSGAQLNMIRGNIGKILKVLKDMLNGKSSAGATPSARPTLSNEDKLIAQNIYSSVSAFDQTLVNYEQDSSNENREIFAKAHADAKAVIDSAPIDIKGEISDLWGQIDLNMQGLKVGTNKFTKFTSFGMSAGTSGAQLNMIRGSIGKILKVLKDMIGTPVSAPAPVAPEPVQVEQNLFCENCGAKNEADSCFCFSCGNPLKPTAEPVEVAQPEIIPEPVIAPVQPEVIPEPVIAPVPVAEPIVQPEPVVQQKETASFCPTCGRQNTDGSLFCFACGTKLTEEPFNQPVAPTPVAPAPQVQVAEASPYTPPIKEQPKEKPKSKIATAFSVLGLVFGAILMFASFLLYFYYTLNYRYPPTIALVVLIVFALFSSMFSIAGLISSIVLKKKGYNCTKSLVLSIIGLALGVLTIFYNLAFFIMPRFIPLY